MKQAYPIVLTPDEIGYTVYIPDFDIGTQGDSLAEALDMAQDAIGLMGIDLEDDKKKIPQPRGMADIQAEAGEIVSLVAVDFAEYRRRCESRAVKKNCTIPAWLSAQAEDAGINFSAVLQAALKRELHIADR